MKSSAMMKDYFAYLDRLYRRHPFTVGFTINGVMFILILLSAIHWDKPNEVTVRKAEQPRISTPASALNWRTKR